MRHSRTVLATALAVSVVVATGPASATSRDARARPDVVLVGAGAGHGHGLSQYGAEGAARKGLTYRQIVRFYYPGLAWGTSGGIVKVLISGDTSTDVVVIARPGLTAQRVAGGRVIKLAKAVPRASRFRIVPASGHRSEVDARTSKGWHKLAILAGDVQFGAGGKPVTLVTPSGRTSYRGLLRSATPAGGRGRDTVNVLGLDSYLQGVVPQEVPALWHPAAVQAQAVAARTYAAYERAHPIASDYQICDSDQCQVYGGFSAEYSASNTAVRATHGLVLTAGGKPAFTQFSASNGGYTSPGGFPYLPAKKDPYDGWSGNRYNQWSAPIPVDTIEHVFPEIGSFRSLNLKARDGRGRFGGRVGSVVVSGSAGSTTVSGDTFRSYFGLYSTLFTVRSGG